jgi:hypothetical protein
LGCGYGSHRAADDAGGPRDAHAPSDADSGPGDASGGGDAGRDASLPEDASSTPDTGGPDGAACSLKPCWGRVHACGDCMDNDGDGFIDDQDPECLGPCDHYEHSLDVYLHGLRGCNRDCYFDDNEGSGNDKCEWALQCDPLAPVPTCCDPDLADGPCEIQRTCLDAEEQHPLCHEVCLPLVPNGCDCFGCCDVRTTANPHEAHWVYLGSREKLPSGAEITTCTLVAAQAGDDLACRPCTPLPTCLNPCGECQLCLGRSSLPDHCLLPDAPPRCDRDGQQPCGLAGDSPCPAGQFCLTGCCMGT